MVPSAAEKASLRPCCCYSVCTILILEVLRWTAFLLKGLTPVINFIVVLIASRLNVGWLRDQIAVVEQTTTLFPGTVFENIVMFRDDITLESVQDAAKTV